MAYIVHLKKQFKSPGAVSNYLSGARLWFLATTGTTAPFDTHHVTVLKKGLTRSMAHRPNQIPPLGVGALKHAIRVLDALGKQARVVKALLLIAFFTALRQSNLLVNRNADLPSEHVLLAKDLQIRKGELLITMHTSKTVKSPADKKTFRVPMTDTQLCCPVRAWQSYTAVTRLDPDAPAFVTTKGVPLTVKGATNLLRKTLMDSDYPDPSRFTLHALRRGAIHACVKAGAKLDSVRELGQWASRAIDCYLPSKGVIADAPATLRAYVG